MPASQNSMPVPEIRKPSGWRKATRDLGMAEQLAQVGESKAVPKSRAFVACKRVGAHIGLKAADMMLLDILGAFSQAQDWEEGQRPIVWASNAYLIEQTGFSLSALKRHARRLAEVGVICFKDSPNGKRWGHRNADGVIIEAYGFDLSPLAARAAEFEVLHEELKMERAQCQRLKRQITVARRMIRARIEAAVSEALQGPWAQLASLFEGLLAHLPRRAEASAKLKLILDRFKALQDRVEAAFMAADQAHGAAKKGASVCVEAPNQKQEMDPTGATNGPDILTTKKLKTVTCKTLEEKEAADVSCDIQSGSAKVNGLQEWVSDVRKKRSVVDLSTIMQACPEFASWARNLGGFVSDWAALHRVAGQLRPMIGVSEQAWIMAQERLGKPLATAVFVLVFEKHSAGEISSPGGYIRGMVEKAGAGELHLERSFYGRLSAQRA